VVARADAGILVLQKIAREERRRRKGDPHSSLWIFIRFLNDLL
jgi:hypothetical protein